MKTAIFFLVLSSALYSQNNSINSDGRIKEYGQNVIQLDLNGDGIIDNYFIPSQNRMIPADKMDSPENLIFSNLWTSPPGAFTNCWDGIAGYFDNDTLLDIAGYTFNPNVFYIWEQSPNNPDSFSIVFQYTKQEFGGFGPMAYGDIDGDGKMDIVVADFATFSRIYLFSNTGDKTFVSRETQSALVHTNDGYSAQSLIIADLNKNGQKEIICSRGQSSPTTAGMVRIWEHTGGTGTYNFTNLYTYNTVSYLFGKSGLGDSDGDGWDEVFLTYGGNDNFNTNIRKIEFDSASGTFNAQIFSSTAIGLPVSYKVADVNNDGIKELISTQSSNGRAACYIFKSTGQNQYQTIDSIFENSDPNTMMISDIKLLTGDTYPTILCGSFGGKIYMYQFNGASFTKVYENLNYPGAAIRRVYWLPWTGYDGYFNTWSSSSSNGTFYLFKKDIPNGISNNNQNVPAEFKLMQNYPNPFNPVTIIKYSIPFPGGLPEGKNVFVKLSIYDALGRESAILVNKEMAPGSYSVTWDGSNFPSGIYFYRLVVRLAGSSTGDNSRTGINYSDTKKLVLIK